jgi:hypothetical protein
MQTRLAASITATIALACGGALARPATYQCGEDREVTIDFTPRKAQLHLGDSDHTLQRVKSARDGHYVNHKAGYELIANKGDLRMREGKTEVHCKLKVTP